jgi:RNA polymerase sigma-70 factor, ECF subfamily
VKEETHDASDELLLRAREPAAFAALVRAHQRSVFSLALRMLCDRQQAEDLAQEVFLQLHGSLSTVQSASHLRFWLRRVTMNKAIDRLRRERLFQVVPLEEHSSPIDERDQGDPLLQRRLQELVAQLAPAPRAVVVLRYQEDLDPVEIARTLNMSINTVKSHLKRSLAALRKGLGQDEGNGMDEGAGTLT